MKIFKEKKEKNQEDGDWRISALIVIRYISVGVMVIFGLRLLSILWQKSILQLCIEGWTDDLLSIYYSIGIIALMIGAFFFSEGKRYALSSEKYNNKKFLEEEQKKWEKRMGLN